MSSHCNISTQVSSSFQQYFDGPKSNENLVNPTVPPQQPRKRIQVKNACTHCKKACKKCDDNRPCKRCVTYGWPGDCVDSPRKSRQHGVKRGPYKKRNRGVYVSLSRPSMIYISTQTPASTCQCPPRSVLRQSPQLSPHLYHQRLELKVTQP